VTAEKRKHFLTRKTHQKEVEMKKELLQRKSSTPVPYTFNTTPNVRGRRVSVPIKLEVIWETLSSASCSRLQESPRSTDELKLPDITSSQSGMNFQNLGHMNLDAFGNTVLTGRKLSLPDDFSMKTNPTLTSQRQNAFHKDCTYNYLEREKKAHQERCEALRQFITNAEVNFDSNKEKAIILCNWMSSQAVLYGS